MSALKAITFINNGKPKLQIFWKAGASEGGFTLKIGESYPVDGGVNELGYCWKDTGEAFTSSEKARVVNVFKSPIVFTKLNNPPGFVGSEDED